MLKSKHIPFRNSTLTFLLSDSLSNDSKTLMFVNMSPLNTDADESICSLNFASRVCVSVRSKRPQPILSHKLKLTRLSLHPSLNPPFHTTPKIPQTHGGAWESNKKRGSLHQRARVIVLIILVVLCIFYLCLKPPTSAQTKRGWQVLGRTPREKERQWVVARALPPSATAQTLRTHPLSPLKQSRGGKRTEN